MNYSLDDLNRYIETEKYEYEATKDYCKTIATVDFHNTPYNEFMASIEVFRYVKKTHNTSVNNTSYHEFKRMFEEGLIDIVHLTSRQKLLFLTCLSDSVCVRNMMLAGAKNEEEFCKLRKILPTVVRVLRESDLYDPNQIKVADCLARWFLKCNHKVLNYQKYIDFAKQVSNEENI
jgi:hypothetical protein